MTIKVAFFLPALDDGGAQKVLVTLANSLVNLNYSVDFVLSNAIGTYLSGLDSKIKVFDLGQKHVVSSIFGLGRYLRTQKHAVLISGLSNANAMAIMACKIYLSSCKVIITQHVNWSQVLLNNPSRKKKLSIVFQNLSTRLRPGLLPSRLASLKKSSK